MYRLIRYAEVQYTDSEFQRDQLIAEGFALDVAVESVDNDAEEVSANELTATVEPPAVESVDTVEAKQTTTSLRDKKRK
nr:MAG TPA: hypothetical protein [Caudoviricetes sp.]